ncbi:hypothetical protein M3P36_13595 [Altererythrobacter sp. KTW20L]|uniref:hypothetical protein n=1 Tax=Altererythrobacter sp. KTW20L TaxID=2942210 RepID=UPI0020BD555C|nr:hypothetical protein [Altererythrobacter sp. KTW20L]MCL6252075.1 hypothetical protein [Altererythrobacter sp. KTW20L]
MDNRLSAEERRRLKIRFGTSDYESIYKYISLDGKQSWNYFEKTLVDCSIIGSTIRSLNDPWEGSPRIFDDFSEETFADCSVFFDNDGIIKDQRKEKYAIDFDDCQSIITKRLENTVENARIVSFAKRADSHLLWSHYANSHKALVFTSM